LAGRDVDKSMIGFTTRSPMDYGYRNGINVEMRENDVDEEW